MFGKLVFLMDRVDGMDEVDGMDSADGGAPQSGRSGQSGQAACRKVDGGVPQMNVSASHMPACRQAGKNGAQAFRSVCK